MWPNGWMDEDATWYESIDLGPGHIVIDGCAALRERGAAAPPLFGPCILWVVAIMWPLATVAHLSYC